MDGEGRLSRRGFVGAGAGTAAVAAIGAPGALGRGPGDYGGRRHRSRLLPRSRIGIQLFTVRDQVAALGFEAVFARLSQIGYREVEFAGYNAQGRRWTNEELRRLLRRYGLRGIGSHVNYFSADPNAYSFVTQLEQVLDDAEEIGLPYIGTASRPGQRYGDTVEGYRRAAEDFNRFGAAARQRGMRFYQHNHSEEFAVENETRLYDVLLEETDPRLVFFELDIFWAYVGQSRFPGFKPHEYPWSMPERFPLFHVKDGIDYSNVPAVTGQFFDWDMTDVGDGDIAFEPFFCGLDTRRHHYLVERDTAPDPVRNPAGSFSTAERSYAYLAGLRERRGGRSRRG
ncbi:MAG: sugar phosphate isomerase/epimerase [Thermoleophilaceae bacterium]|nr:sugar phosphate isomerase/epimerase [Thermoleophilaceae bacterium]